ncbi:MAG: ABC transporter substrate-binding protein [Phycisphaerales bacterium]
MRVVSLLPSATETLCAIGGRDLLVGRSHECDFPADLAGLDLPILTAARTHATPAATDQPTSPSALIDAQVRDLLARREPLYTLDAALLADLHPDLILTQDVCEVCSIDLATVERIVADAARSGLPTPTILSLNPHTVEDVLDDMLRVGEAVGLKPQASRAVVRLQERLTAAQSFVNPYEEGPIVGFLEWTDPPFIAGHWTVQLIERAGGLHPLNPTIAPDGFGSAAGMQQGSRRAGKSIAVEPEVFAATRPNCLVVAPCGLDLEAAWDATKSIASHEWFQSLPAVRAGRVAVADGNQMFNRPGPRLVDAFEWLVSWLQNRPELAPPGFPVRAWRNSAATPSQGADQHPSANCARK